MAEMAKDISVVGEFGRVGLADKMRRLEIYLSLSNAAGWTYFQTPLILGSHHQSDQDDFAEILGLYEHFPALLGQPPTTGCNIVDALKTGSASSLAGLISEISASFENAVGSPGILEYTGRRSGSPSQRESKVFQELHALRRENGPAIRSEVKKGISRSKYWQTACDRTYSKFPGPQLVLHVRRGDVAAFNLQAGTVALGPGRRVVGRDNIHPKFAATDLFRKSFLEMRRQGLTQTADVVVLSDGSSTAKQLILDRLRSGAYDRSFSNARYREEVIEELTRLDPDQELRSFATEIGAAFVCKPSSTASVLEDIALMANAETVITAHSSFPTVARQYFPSLRPPKVIDLRDR